MYSRPRIKVGPPSCPQCVGEMRAGAKSRPAGEFPFRAGAPRVPRHEELTWKCDVCGCEIKRDTDE